MFKRHQDGYKGYCSSTWRIQLQARDWQRSCACTYQLLVTSLAVQACTKLM
jgi:hypothetical protein